MSSPVTVEFERRTDPARAGDAIVWLEEGLRLAQSCEGCLGGGFVRDADDETVLTAMCRFADARALADWERSELRRSWLDAGSSLVLDARVQRRTGIEGWFDSPRLRRQIDTRTGETRAVAVRSAPLRWKQLVAIGIAMYPANLLVAWLAGQLPWWVELPLPLRSVLLVLLLAPFMTFVMMPGVTRLLRPWLRRNPGLIRTQRSLLEALDARAEERRADRGQ